MLIPVRRATSSNADTLAANPRGPIDRRMDPESPLPRPHFTQTLRPSLPEPINKARLPATQGQPPAAIGFLTVVEDDTRGYIGGLLITNPWGRPLEFQCTTAVKPNRVQEILYGSTLRGFLFGELIGHTLLAKVKQQPDIVFVDDDCMLSLRPNVEMPVVALAEGEDRVASTEYPVPSSEYRIPSTEYAVPEPAAPPSCRHADPRMGLVDAAEKPAPAAASFRHHADYPRDLVVLTALGEARERIQDFREPFDRIRLCIEEVYR